MGQKSSRSKKKGEYKIERDEKENVGQNVRVQETGKGSHDIEAIKVPQYHDEPVQMSPRHEDPPLTLQGETIPVSPRHDPMSIKEQEPIRTDVEVVETTKVPEVTVMREEAPVMTTGTTTGFSGAREVPDISQTLVVTTPLEEVGHVQTSTIPVLEIREHDEGRREERAEVEHREKKGFKEIVREKTRRHREDKEYITHINFEEWCRANDITATEPLATPEMDIERVLTRLNELRAVHGAPPVEVDPVLSKQAQLWAEHMAVNNKLDHSLKACENVAFFSKQPVMDETAYVIAALDSWYDEVKNYNFKKHKHQNESSNFTAMVWRNVYLVGVGVCEHNGLVFVCMSLDPFANITDEFKENVLPLEETTQY